MAAKKAATGEKAEARGPRTLLSRAGSIVKLLEPCSPEERKRVMVAVAALSAEEPKQPALPGIAPVVED